MGPRFSLTLLAIIILAVIVGVLAAQSQPKTIAAPPVPTSTPAPLPTPLPNQVYIEPAGSGDTSSYVPARIVVRVGQTVTWVNLDALVHSVTADNAAFNRLLEPGDFFTWRAKKAGTFSYGDYLYPDLRGVVVVEP